MWASHRCVVVLFSTPQIPDLLGSTPVESDIQESVRYSGVFGGTQLLPNVFRSAIFIVISPLSFRSHMICDSTKRISVVKAPQYVTKLVRSSWVDLNSCRLPYGCGEFVKRRCAFTDTAYPVPSLLISHFLIVRSTDYGRRVRTYKSPPVSKVICWATTQFYQM